MGEQEQRLCNIDNCQENYGICKICPGEDEHNLNLKFEKAPVADFQCSDGLSLREPDCNAVDCQYNAEARCKARPFISVNSKGECLDYDVLTDEEYKLING